MQKKSVPWLYVPISLHHLRSLHYSNLFLFSHLFFSIFLFIDIASMTSFSFINRFKKSKFPAAYSNQSLQCFIYLWVKQRRQSTINNQCIYIHLFKELAVYDSVIQIHTPCSHVGHNKKSLQCGHAENHSTFLHVASEWPDKTVWKLVTMFTSTSA